MKNPLYDVIIGNIRGARDATSPQQTLQSTHAVPESETFGSLPESLRTLSHGDTSSSKSGSQNLASSASRGPKSASLIYSRDEMLTIYESCTESSVPDGVLVLPDIAIKKCQPPLASVPSYPEKQNLLSHASRGNAASVKLGVESSKHSAKGRWRDGVNTRGSDRNNTSRGNHLRDDFSDDSIGSIRRDHGRKDLTASYRHPEFSRSMTSDNWREAKKRHSEIDAGVVSWSSRQDHIRPVKRWRNSPERDEPRGGGRSHRESDGRDSVHYDRGIRPGLHLFGH